MIVRRLFLLLFANTAGSQRMLESHELLLGTWETTIRTVAKSSTPFIVDSLEAKKQSNNRRLSGVLKVFRNHTCVLLLSGSLQRLEGRWHLTKNPYCPTDRFHDTVRFEFLGNGLVGTCRLTGHYSAAGWRRGSLFARGRLSHGVWKYNTNPEPSLFVTLGCFDATRDIDSEDTIYDLDEEEYRQFFGY